MDARWQNEATTLNVEADSSMNLQWAPKIAISNSRPIFFRTQSTFEAIFSDRCVARGLGGSTLYVNWSKLIHISYTLQFTFVCLFVGRFLEWFYDVRRYSCCVSEPPTSWWCRVHGSTYAACLWELLCTRVCWLRTNYG